MALSPLNIEEKVQVLSHYSGAFTFEELTNKLLTEMEEVPSEYRGTIKFEIEKNEEWEQYQEDPTISARLYMTYIRPETDEEFRVRLKKYELRIDIQKANDLATFERLKKQLGK